MTLDTETGNLGSGSRLDLWQRPKLKARRAGLSLEQISNAAIEITDQEGLSALSMRRLASSLGIGTMSLYYYYVRDKDELLALICNQAMAEAVLSEEELGHPWPDAMLAIAHRTLDMLQRHPWFPQIESHASGPNTTRHFDQTLQVVMRLDLSLIEQVALANTVDEYVYGFFAYGHPVHTEEIKDATSHIASLIETGNYPALKSLSADLGLANALDLIGAARSDLSRFDRNLRHLLDQYSEKQS